MTSPRSKWIVNIPDEGFFKYISNKLSAKVFCDIHGYWGCMQFVVFGEVYPRFLTMLRRNGKWKEINGAKTPERIPLNHAYVTLPMTFDNTNRDARWHVAHWQSKVSGFMEDKTYGISFSLCDTLDWSYNVFIVSWLYNRAVSIYGEENIRVQLPIQPLEKPLVIRGTDGVFALVAPIAGTGGRDNILYDTQEIKF